MSVKIEEHLFAEFYLFKYMQFYRNSLMEVNWSKKHMEHLVGVVNWNQKLNILESIICCTVFEVIFCNHQAFPTVARKIPAIPHKIKFINPF